MPNSNSAIEDQGKLSSPIGTVQTVSRTVSYSAARHRTLSLWIIGLLTFVGIAAAQLLPALISREGALKVGDVAPRDIRAISRTNFVSEVETNRQAELASAAVAPIYTPPDAQIARRQLNLARETLDKIGQIRTNKQTDDGERLRQLTGLPNLPLNENAARAILKLDDARWQVIDSRIVSILDELLRSSIRTDNIDSVKARVPSMISLIFGTDEASLMTGIVSALLVPNTSFDTVATNAARQRARAQVKPVERTFEPNQIVVRGGEIIGQADLEALNKLNLTGAAVTWLDVLIVIAISAFTVLVCGLSLARSSYRLRLRSITLSALLFIGALFLTRWLVPGRQFLPYILPLASVGMVITVWSGELMGIASAAMLAVLAGMNSDKPIELAAVYAAAGVITVLALRRPERTTDFVRAGLIAALGQLLVVAIFSAQAWTTDGDWLAWLTKQMVALAGCLISVALAPILLYLAGWLFGMITPLQLMELARPSHPAIQRLLHEAPGTYHHSLMVANLAEHGAESIEADSLLTRVGAYYHDIGKLKQPFMFIENQMGSANPHDELTPLESAHVLHEHVTEGLRLARRYHLPLEVRAFIAEHHGTTRTGAAYARAVKANNNELVDDAPYRYPGPRPQSRETALLMLADSCEALVRAKRPATLEDADQIVRRLFEDRMSDHQLDEANLTLREIELIRLSFIDTLRGSFHARVDYPEVGAKNDNTATKSARKPLSETSKPASFSPDWEQVTLS